MSALPASRYATPRLQALRDSAGLTRVGLAHRLGVESRDIGRWESGDSPIPEPIAQRLAHVFGVSSGFLRGGPVSETTETLGELVDALAGATAAEVAARDARVDAARLEVTVRAAVSALLDDVVSRASAGEFA